MGAGNVLAVNGPFFLVWLGWSTPPCYSFIGPNQHQSVDFQVPLKFETFFFFLRGGGRIELQLSLVTDLTAAERRKHSFNNSHICAWYTATEQGKDLGAGGRLFCFVTVGDPEKQANKHTTTKKTCCEATFSPPTLLPCQDEDLFRLTCRLVGWPLLCPALRWRKGEFMFTSVAAGEGGGWS